MAIQLPRWILKGDMFLSAIMKLWLLVYPFSTLFDSNIDTVMRRTNESTGFRWAVPWPDSSAMIEYRVQWKKNERTYPSELRIMSSSCDTSQQIEAHMKVADGGGRYIHVGDFNLNLHLSWIIPLHETMFDDKDVLSVRFRQVRFQKSCGVVLSRWTKSASLPWENLFITYGDNISLFAFETAKGEIVTGVLMAQIFSPNF